MRLELSTLLIWVYINFEQMCEMPTKLSNMPTAKLNIKIHIAKVEL